MPEKNGVSSMLGVVVVAVIGNAAEHSSAVLMAARNKMDLAFGIAMGSYWAYYELGWGGFWFWDPVASGGLDRKSTRLNSSH